MAISTPTHLEGCVWLDESTNEDFWQMADSLRLHRRYISTEAAAVLV